MRILQLIDSLDAGGAEKMAVTYANSLSGKIEFSALIATRREGVLRSQIFEKVSYLFLRKKRSVDINAIKKLRNFCTENHIGFLHAHGSSFFTAFLLKLILPSIKVIWHDHNGDRDKQHRFSNKALWFASFFFSGVIVVNHKIKKWITSELKCEDVIYLPNYTVVNDTQPATTQLKGISGKKIVHLANLRHPKNHLLLIDVAAKVKVSHPEWTLHFIGKDYEDLYSATLKGAIMQLGLNETVYIYGQKNDIGNIIEQAAVCVLSSSYEGLPVALLEYGSHGKPVVVTDVGEIPAMVENGKNGYLVASDSPDDFYKSLKLLMDSPQLRHHLGFKFNQTVRRNHSEEAVIAQYIMWLEIVNAKE